jgi:LPS sulfotransferase NodH
LDVQLHKRVRRLSARFTSEEIASSLCDPVFILSAPRAGSTLLFSLMGNSPDIWTIGGESHGIYAQFPHLSKVDEAFKSGALDTHHADPATIRQLHLLYLASLRNVRGEWLYDLVSRGLAKGGVFLEKTPRNALNIPFLLKAFPTARFIFLHRSPRSNIASIMEGWETGAKTGQFVTYRDLPGRPGPWSFLLPPGWQALKAATLPEIAAFQWREANAAILRDLPKERSISLTYEELIADPSLSIARLCHFCGVATGEALDSLTDMPLSASTVTPPAKDKWRRYETDIQAVEVTFSDIEADIRAHHG